MTHVDDIEDMIGGGGVHSVSSPKSSSSTSSSTVTTVRIRKLRRQPSRDKTLSSATSPSVKGDCEGNAADNNACSSSSSCACSNVTTKETEACVDDTGGDLITRIFDEVVENDDATSSGACRFSQKTSCVDEEGDDDDGAHHDNGNSSSSSPPPELLSNDLNPANVTVFVKTWGCSHNNSDSEYMAGLLAREGYNVTTTDYSNSSLVILNSCTVKGPSEQHFKNEIDRAVVAGKRLILAGCVPQSDVSYRKLPVPASVIGTQQIDRIVEVVEETLRGNRLSYVSARRNGVRSPGADLSLPKIRKNELIEIVPISTGCLNNCTYCKTKQARGQLASYSIESIVSRISHVCENEGVMEIWLTSEDLGAWGIDLGLTIVDLLNAIVAVLPRNVMLRLGMTNPPYILDHLQEISEILSHPNVYEFLHIPVQSGSDSVLLEMKREYDSKQFMRICDFMIQRHPNITIATDVICGYPTETESDFDATFALVEKYRFPVLFINQFYPRPGTAAAKLKRIPTEIVKARTRRLNDLFLSYSPLDDAKLVGSVQRVLVTEVAHDKKKLVGHNKAYQQVLIDPEAIGAVDKLGNNRATTVTKDDDGIMGQWVDVEIIKCPSKFSMEAGRGVIVDDHHLKVDAAATNRRKRQQQHRGDDKKANGFVTGKLETSSAEGFIITSFRWSLIGVFVAAVVCGICLVAMNTYS